MEMTNKLTEAQLERLAILSEEMGEVQQVIGKIIRHGYDTNNPLDSTSKTNRELLEMELGDMSLMMLLMMDEKDIDLEKIDERTITKIPKLNKWMHHNRIDPS